MEQTGTTKDFYYIHSDYLGSIEYVTGQNGSLEQELSYDPWGRLRNPVDWSYSSIPSPKFGRGFTTHEHLDEFNLINMNGRVYDPILGMFLSPDNYVQWPGYTQNYNRYGYALNNPMKFIDPTGDNPLAWIVPAIIAGIQNYQDAKKTGLDDWEAIAYAGSNFLFTGATSMINVPGILPNAAIHAGMNVVGNGISNSILGRDFFDDWETTAISGSISGGISGYLMAKESHYERNVVFGNLTRAGREDAFLDFTMIHELDQAGMIRYSFEDLENAYAQTRPISPVTDKTISVYDAAKNFPNGVISEYVFDSSKLMSLKKIEANVVHEKQHIIDFRTGEISRIYQKYGSGLKFKAKAEIRAHQRAIKWGFQKSYNLQRINYWWNRAF